MGVKKVLFVCQHNSARSQMAEAFLNDLGGGVFEAHSAGLEPGVINPHVVTVMQELGYDLSHNTTQSVFELYKAGKLYEVVVTVCDAEVESKCPIFPGLTLRLHWPFPDPSLARGTDEEVLEQIRTVRDNIRSAVERFISGN